MIGKLKGVIDTIGEDHLVLDVHGVGYLVQLLQPHPAAPPPAPARRRCSPSRRMCART